MRRRGEIANGRAARAAPPLLLAALASGGCAGEPVREAELWLGRNARIEIDGESFAPNEDGPTRVELPVGERLIVRITEPRKPALVAEIWTLADPPAEVEDRVIFDSTANVLVVRTARAPGMTAAGGAGPLALFEDPLARLRDPAGGPFFLPHDGEGLLLACDAPDAALRIDGAPARPPEGGLGHPAPIPLRPGPHRVEVARPGRKPWSGEVTVRPREYQYLFVRLAKERVEDVLGREAQAEGPVR